MKLEWRTSEAVEGGFHIPKVAILFFDDKSIELTERNAHKVAEFIKTELGHEDAIFSFKMQSDDMNLSFIMLVNPARNIIYIPPGALVTNRSYPGAGSKIQKIFEEISRKNGYKLMVCIAANEAGIFNTRVQDILMRSEGYHLAPTPSTRKPHAKQFGIHQTTYAGDGLEELGVKHEEMLLAGDMN